jgi:hypothetical protein
VASFVGFPLAGLAARAVTGPIDSTAAAITGGLAAGAVLGAVQALAVRRPIAPRWLWAAVTSVAFATGLAVGATVVDFGHEPSDLVVMGVLTGLPIGLAQAAVLAGGTIRRCLWALITPAVWGLGWAITALVISNTDDQFANFGASGALVATCLGGLVLAARPAGGEA